VIVSPASESVPVAASEPAAAPVTSPSPADFPFPGDEERPAGPVWPRRMPRWAAAAALVVTAAVVLVRPKAPLVAVGAIENETGAAATEVSQLPSLVTTELARSERLRVIGRRRLAELARRLAAGADSVAFEATAAREAGAGELVEGTLYRRPAGYRLDLRRVELPSGIVRGVASAEGQDAFEVVRRASAELAGGNRGPLAADAGMIPAFHDWPRWRLEP
jgi:hypothetical protein